MRVCFWSSTFQADNYALADFLARTGTSEVTVALQEPERFCAEPISAIAPFRGRMLERDTAETKRALTSEAFDVLVVDNHLPSYAIAPRVYVLWHGFGWRIDDLSTTRRELKKLVSDVTVPNPSFRWQAFGDWDQEYRVTHSGLAVENVVALGSPYSDLLRPESEISRRLDREALQRHYTIDLARPVVLLGLTWHHGGSLGHWGDEEQLLSEVVAHVAARGASTLLRMHDRYRYSRDYVRLVERLAERHEGALMLKWKSSSPDSLLDMCLSSVCVSNYSSLLNHFYYTGRPSIHIDPYDVSKARQTTYKMFLGRPMPRNVADGDLWKLPPEEHGGLRARAFPELLAHIDRAIAEPDCCREQASAFVAKYITGADGRTCERVASYLERWVAGDSRERADPGQSR